MRRYENTLNGRVLWEGELPEDFNPGDWAITDVSEDQIEKTLCMVRVYTMVAGGVLVILPGADPHPLAGDLADLGFRLNATYSRKLGHAPGRPGFADEQEWTRQPGALTTIARKVAFEQAAARKAA